MLGLPSLLSAKKTPSKIHEADPSAQLHKTAEVAMFAAVSLFNGNMNNGKPVNRKGAVFLQLAACIF